MVLHWAKLEQLPKLTEEKVKRGLQLLRIARKKPPFLQSPEVRRLLEAALRHDQERNVQPVAPFILFLLLSGCRRGEALGLRWSQVNLDAHRGAGEILIDSTSKTHSELAILLEVSPALRALLAALRAEAVGADLVFGNPAPRSKHELEGARIRLTKHHAAPTFTWQSLRATCATFLACSGGIFGSASIWHAAQQLGHGVEVAQKHYARRVTIPLDARTLEAALGIEDLADRTLTVITAKPAETLEAAQ